MEPDKHVADEEVPAARLQDDGTLRAQLEKIGAMLRAGDASGAWRELQDIGSNVQNGYDYQQLLGVAALKIGNVLKAESAFTAALQLAQNAGSKAAAIGGMAEVMLAEGNSDSAESYARQALSLQPRGLDYYQLLARCYTAQGRIVRAVDFLKTSMLAMPPKVRFVLQLQLADILIQASQAREALTFIEEVEHDQPRHLDVLARKATALELLGRFREAAAYYRRVAELAPTLPIYTRLAKLTPADEFGNLVPVLLEKLRVCPTSDVDLLINLHFALACAYDGTQRYDDAFKHLQTGNKLKRSELKFSINVQREAFTRIAAFFSAATLARFSGKTPTILGATPIFIFGMPRSGTSLVEQILGAHSQVQPAGELPYMDQITTDLGRRWESNSGAMPRDNQLLSDFEEFANRYRKIITELANGARFVTDKSPINFRHLGLIRLLFPDAILIHCRRDPMDTCLSCYQQLFSSNHLAFTYDLEELGNYYRLYDQYMTHWTKVLEPQAWLDVPYEDMIADFEPGVRRLLDHCHLTFEPTCLEFYKSDRTVLTASSVQVRRPLYADSVGKWRHYASYLEPLIQALSLTKDDGATGPSAGANAGAR